MALSNYGGERSYIYGQVKQDAKGFESVKSFDKMNESELIEYNEMQFKRILSVRTHATREALMGILFFLGQQYLQMVVTDSASIPITPPVAGGRVRTVDNRIKPIVRSEHARLTRNRPTGTVLPQGTDPADIRAARAADDVILHTYRESELDNYIEDAILWSLFGGSALLNCHWSPTKLSPFDEPGDYIFRSLSVFEYGVPQLRTARLDDQPYIMVTKAFDVDEIYEKWGVAVEPETMEKQGLLEQQLKGALTYTLTGIKSGDNWGGRGSGTGQDIPQAIVRELWLRPCRLAPEGAVLITTSSKLLEISTWPDWCRNRFPFSRIDYIRIPGSAYGGSLTQDLIPIQRRHNRAISVIIESMNLAAQLGVAIPRGTNIRKILAGQGTAYEVPNTATTPVSNVNPANIGDLPFRELENTANAFADIAFRHEVSQGINPSYVRAGTQLDLLKEFDDAASVVAQRTIERAVQRIGNIILDVAKTQWPLERQILVLGKNSDLERQSFISSNNLDTAGQFVVTPGSAWPYSKGERQNMVMQLMDSQVITPDEALEHLELGTSRALVERRNVDRRHAQRENMKFEMFGLQTNAEGSVNFSQEDIQKMMPADWHNHSVHMEEHNNFRKSAEYEDWPDWKKKWFEAHIKGHEFSVIAQMKGMQALDQTPVISPSPEMPPSDNDARAAGRFEGLKSGEKQKAQESVIGKTEKK